LIGIARDLGATHTALYAGVKFKPASVLGTGVPILSFIPSLGVAQGIAANQSGSELELRLAGYTLSSATTGLGLVGGAYYAIELSAVFSSGTSWTVTLRMNGTVVLGPSTVNLGCSTLRHVLIGADTSWSTNFASRTNDRWDSLYVDDSDFALGGADWKVQATVADGAGAHADWSPDSGSNYARVNELNVNDASYVQATNDGDEDTYSYANPTHISGHSVRAVQVNSRAAYLSSAKNLAHIIRDGGGTEGQGADKALSSSLGYIGTVFNKQANGTTDWSNFSDLDSYEIGRKQRA
jgi:hypothetical protein